MDDLADLLLEGQSFHPANWPHDPPDLTGKRVAVIGTGATAIQLIPEVAKEAAQLTVFQRRPNWAAPLQPRSRRSATIRSRPRWIGRLPSPESWSALASA